MLSSQSIKPFLQKMQSALMEIGSSSVVVSTVDISEDESDTRRTVGDGFGTSGMGIGDLKSKPLNGFTSCKSNTYEINSSSFSLLCCWFFFCLSSSLFFQKGLVLVYFLFGFWIGLVFLTRLLYLPRFFFG